jgi:hypothetical protein
MPELTEKQFAYLEKKYSADLVKLIKETVPASSQTKLCRQMLDYCTYQYIISMCKQSFRDYQRRYAREYYRKTIRNNEKPLRKYVKNEDKIKGLQIENKKIIVSFD